MEIALSAYPARVESVVQKGTDFVFGDINLPDMHGIAALRYSPSHQAEANFLEL